MITRAFDLISLNLSNIYMQWKVYRYWWKYISKFVTCTSEYIFSDLTLSLFQGVQGIMEMTTMETETIIEKASDLSLISDIFMHPHSSCVLSIRTVLNVCYFMTPSFPLCFNYGFFFIMCIKHKMQCFSHVIFCSHKN